MASAITNYKNVFNEPATLENLSHIFDILNEKNDDRIVFRDFCKTIKHVGLNTILSQKEQRSVFDHIASSVEKNRSITKESWTKGIDIAHQEPNTKLLYQHILAGRQYNAQAGRVEIEMGEIKSTLQETKAPWLYRIECMESLCRQITHKKMRKDKLHSIFKPYLIALTKQARDRRSNVSRVSCEVLAKIILRWKHEFLKYSYTTIEYIYELVRQKIQIVHESGYAVLEILLKNCGDHKEYKIMDILGRAATTSKFVNLQKDCFDLLHLYLVQQSAKLKKKNEFWSKLLQYTQSGVNDTADVRNSALTLLAEIERERPQMAAKVVQKMGVHLKKRYESQYQNTGDDEKSQFRFQPNEINTNTARSQSLRNQKSVSFSPKSFSQPTSPKTPMSPKSPRTPKGRRKSKASVNFPKPPKGEFLNGFGRRLNENDILFAFQFIDYKNDRKITLDEFEICCKRLNVADKKNSAALFHILDEEKTQSVNIETFKSNINKRDSALMDFWYKVLSGTHLQHSPLSNDIDFENANKLLLNNKNSPDIRLNAMFSITRKICGLKKYDNQPKFEAQFKKSLGPLLNQLKDRNNAIIRQVCICFSKIFVAKMAMYKTFSIRTLENLSECIKLQDQKVHLSATQCAAALIKYCPDRNACPLMKVICSNCCAKNFTLLRSASFEFVNYYLFVMLKEFEDKKKIFWDYLDKALASGLNDSDTGVRDLAYIALVKVEMLKKDVAEKYINGLKKSRKEKYNAFKKSELKRVRSGDIYKEVVPTSPKSPKSPKAQRKMSRKLSRKLSRKASKAAMAAAVSGTDSGYKINKRPKFDVSDDEKREEELRKQRQKRKEDRLKREKAHRFEKLKLMQEQERLEEVENEKIENEKKEKEKMEKEKLEQERVENEKMEKLKQEKEEKERLEKEKEKMEELKKEKEEKEKMEKLEKEKEEKEKERLEELKKKKEEEAKMDKVEDNDGDGDGVENDEDYGYPKVHSAAKVYIEDKGFKCKNPSHLVLYAKKKGLDGVSFSKVNKYFKAQK